ncbi:MAG: nucleotidyltransferase family protein [Candidatus Binatia bacterium]
MPSRPRTQLNALRLDCMKQLAPDFLPISLARSFSPEEEMLILCSRTQLRSDEQQRVAQLLHCSLNWQYILEVSIRHGLSPLFYYGLTRSTPADTLMQQVPAPICAELQQLSRGNAARNHRLYRVIGEIMKAFEREGIAAMGLKDLQLAREVYPELGLRPMGDIDILVYQEDYDKVARCMQELGFAPLPHADIPFTRKYSVGHHFRRAADNVWIDLQWDIMQREWDVYREGNSRFDIARLWAGAIPLTIDDYCILVPKPEDMLFHLCLHLEGHQYCEFVLFCDIAEFLHYYQDSLNWDAFVHMTKAYQAESSVYYVLRLTHQLFSTPLPAWVLQELEPPYFNAMLFPPVFGNLTDLHVSLDDIRSASHPPDEVMKQFETVVRRQAVGAMHAYKELDKLAVTFIETGGSVLIPSGSTSEKIFPDASLRPFAEVTFCILASDLPHVQCILQEREFQPVSGSERQTYEKEWQISSTDPLLVDQPTNLRMQVTVERSLQRVLQANANSGGGKKDAALRVLCTKLKDPGEASPATVLPLDVAVVALSPEEVFVWLSARLGKQQQDRLFYLCGVLEFFRRFTKPLDWRQVLTLADQYGIRSPVAEALSIVRGFLSEEQLPAAALELVASQTAQPRMLEWARYGPEAFSRYTDAKRAFYYLFSLLSTVGIAAKGRYVWQSVFGGNGGPSVLPTVLRELTTSTFSSLRRRPATTRDFAYWIEL